MGSRYLIIEFDDETSASRLREQIDKATRAGKRFRVVGLFAKPTDYCRCDADKKIRTKANESNLKRGKKYGWWVCLDCKRPDDRIVGLVNLLKPRDIINPPKWMSRHWKKGPNFEAMHHIISLSASPLGPQGVEFTNSRGE